MSEQISVSDSGEMAALHAALVNGTFTAAAGDLGKALMAAYTMWHGRMGSLAQLTPRA